MDVIERAELKALARKGLEHLDAPDLRIDAARLAFEKVLGAKPKYAATRDPSRYLEGPQTPVGQILNHPAGPRPR